MFSRGFDRERVEQKHAGDATERDFKVKRDTKGTLYLTSKTFSFYHKDSLHIVMRHAKKNNKDFKKLDNLNICF